MKKKVALLVVTLVALICVCFTACEETPVTVDENTVIIAVPQDVEKQSLKSYMDSLQEKGELTYSIENGMVVSINGKSNTTKSFWMLYTSDPDNANNQWGTFEYKDEIYGSAILGATELIIKEQCLYIWAYQTF